MVDAVAAGLRMFLGIQATAGPLSVDGREGTLSFTTNPLADLAEVPDHLSGLRFSQLLCGAVRGSLEAVNVRAEVHWDADMLAGDECYVLRLRLLAHQPEEYPFKDDE